MSWTGVETSLIVTVFIWSADGARKRSATQGANWWPPTSARRAKPTAAETAEKLGRFKRGK
jgi:hypothetical protein